jgi:Flp pilus assembly protein protease CpaA
MAIYAVLALLAWRTLTAVVDVNGRAVPLAWIVYALLAIFALRTWLHSKRLALEAKDSGTATPDQPM